VWPITIQNIQTDLGLQRSSFPNLGLLGDYVFAYDQEKELELQTEEGELWFNGYKKKRPHIREIVDASFLTEEEKQRLREEFTYTHTHSQQTYNPITRRYVERITMF
jgi:hypothetical protein